MKYGTKEATEFIDDEGSTKTRIERINAGMIAKPVRMRYEIRHRTDRTDIATLASLGQALVDDPLKLDTALRFEKTKNGEHDGYYHIVECYTLLEY